jgi:hypothetical protein
VSNSGGVETLSLGDYILAMIDGRVPTAPNFSCPECGGVAHVAARWTKRDWLGVSASCACGSAAELDLDEGRAGYEAILLK